MESSESGTQTNFPRALNVSGEGLSWRKVLEGKFLLLALRVAPILVQVRGEG